MVGPESAPADSYAGLRLVVLGLSAATSVLLLCWNVWQEKRIRGISARERSRSVDVDHFEKFVETPVGEALTILQSLVSDARGLAFQSDHERAIGQVSELIDRLERDMDSAYLLVQQAESYLSHRNVEGDMYNTLIASQIDDPIGIVIEYVTQGQPPHVVKMSSNNIVERYAQLRSNVQAQLTQLKRQIVEKE